MEEVDDVEYDVSWPEVICGVETEVAVIGIELVEEKCVEAVEDDVGIGVVEVGLDPVVTEEEEVMILEV